MGISRNLGDVVKVIICYTTERKFDYSWIYEKKCHGQFPNSDKLSNLVEVEYGDTVTVGCVDGFEGGGNLTCTVGGLKSLNNQFEICSRKIIIISILNLVGNICIKKFHVDIHFQILIPVRHL